MTVWRDGWGWDTGRECFLGGRKSVLRLHGHAMPGLEDLFARVARRVVHVEADVVA